MSVKNLLGVNIAEMVGQTKINEIYYKPTRNINQIFINHPKNIIIHNKKIWKGTQIIDMEPPCASTRGLKSIRLKNNI